MAGTLGTVASNYFRPSLPVTGPVASPMPLGSPLRYGPAPSTAAPPAPDPMMSGAQKDAYAKQYGGSWNGSTYVPGAAPQAPAAGPPPAGAAYGTPFTPQVGAPFDMRTLATIGPVGKTIANILNPQNGPGPFGGLLRKLFSSPEFLQQLQAMYPQLQSDGSRPPVPFAPANPAPTTPPTPPPVQPDTSGYGQQGQPFPAFM